MSVNVPYQDDFDGLFEPILDYQKGAQTFQNFWKIVYAQDDERRIVVDRLVAFGLNAWNGHLDLSVMMFLGSLTLLILVGIVFKWFQETQRSWLLFVPVLFALFNIQFYEAVFWAMIPFQHLAVFIWVFLTLWLVSRGTTVALLVGVLTAIIAIYSDVSGSFVLLPGTLFLVLQQRWKAIVQWAVPVGVIVLAYFLGLKVPEYRPQFSDSFADPVLFVQVLFELVGLWADPGPTFSMVTRQWISIGVGIVSTLGVFALLWKRLVQFIEDRNIHRNELFLWGALMYIGIVFGTLAVGRASEGLVGVINPRYRHMYVYWFIFSYLLLVWMYPVRFEARKMVALVWLVGISFCLNAYYQYWGSLDKYRKVLLSDGYGWFYNKALPSSPIYLALRDRVDSIYQNSYDTGLYKGETYPFAKLKDAPEIGEMKVEITDHPDAVAIALPEFERGLGTNDGAYILLEGMSGTHILPAYHLVKPLHRAVKGSAYYEKGAKTDPYVKQYLTDKEYKVKVGVIKGGDLVQYKTAHTLLL